MWNDNSSLMPSWSQNWNLPFCLWGLLHHLTECPVLGNTCMRGESVGDGLAYRRKLSPSSVFSASAVTCAVILCASSPSSSLENLAPPRWREGGRQRHQHRGRGQLTACQWAASSLHKFPCPSLDTWSLTSVQGAEFFLCLLINSQGHC